MYQHVLVFWIVCGVNRFIRTCYGMPKTSSINATGVAPGDTG